MYGCRHALAHWQKISCGEWPGGQRVGGRKDEVRFKVVRWRTFEMRCSYTLDDALTILLHDC